MKSQHIVILVTTKDKKQATKIAHGLLEAKLIACANIVSGIESLFWWEGKIDSSKEVLLILKTKSNLFKQVETKVKSLHSYQTPEIIAIPIIEGSKDYLRWISSAVNSLPPRGEGTGGG